jgi:LPPG:FO 2-phospho-L-lactate transferase
MIVVLSGGTGTPKLLQGLKEAVAQEELAVIVNTAEDEWLPHGYFSPDIDTVLYTLSDQINEETWYGVKGDSFTTHQVLLNLGYDELLKIGDRDRASHILRGWLMRRGMSLSKAVDFQRKAMGIRAKVYPMSDDKVRTVIVTSKGSMSLHEYLIRHSALNVKEVLFEGIEKAEALPDAILAIRRADGIIIGPSNPISSILPIVSLRGIREAIKEMRQRCIAVSPIIGEKPVSGPADRFMAAKGFEISFRGVAELYREFVSKFVIDSSDSAEPVKELGMKCYKTNILMKTMNDKKALAEFVLDMLRS